jgi:predicted tellurium resistance membrane protein TerC
MGSLMAAAFRDITILAGAGLLSYGAWLVYVPAGYLVAGALLLVAGLAASRAAALAKPPVG